MAKVKVDKKVPLPNKRYDREPLYPFDELEVGDSFFVEAGGTLERHRLFGRLANHKSHSKAHIEGAIFTSRTVLGGVRVWRLQ